jgi:hypothetical protein
MATLTRSSGTPFSATSSPLEDYRSTKKVRIRVHAAFIDRARSIDRMVTSVVAHRECATVNGASTMWECLKSTLTGLSFALLVAGCGSENESSPSDDLSDDPSMTAIEPPAGYGGLIVFIANAEVPIDMVQPVDGEHFHRSIMGRDDAEYEKVRAEALEYFRVRYGVNEADKDPNFFFNAYQVEPFANYRAYYVTDEEVPSEGWEVRDGGWQLRVINPEGYTWKAGEFAGLFAPPGTYVLYGDYNLKTDDCEGKKSCESPREIRMHYRSRCPIQVPGFTLPEVVTFKFSCEVFSDRWGQGLGQGISQPEITNAGAKFQYNAREVITFSENVGF